MLEKIAVGTQLVFEENKFRDNILLKTVRGKQNINNEK